MMIRRVKKHNNDYYRGARARKNGRDPESGHSRMSRANLDYMAGYWDTDFELRDQPQVTAK